MHLRPRQAYRRQILETGLQPDPAQEEALAALERLYEEVTGSRPPRSRGNGRLPSSEAALASLKKLFASSRTVSPQEIRLIRGVWLWGAVGRGKSMLMDLFARSLPPAISHRRVHFHAFMIEVHDWLHRRRGDMVDTLLPDLAAEIAARHRVICFDEFHVHDVADAMILKRLFTALLNRGVVVVATSNYHPDDLYAKGLQRELFLPFIALLKERLEVIHLNGAEDHRARCLQAEGTYFFPLDGAARRRADDVFARLTDHAEPARQVLVVKGREIHVPVVAKGAARLGFAELCERPHGAEEYLTLARTYHTIFLEDVPELGHERRDATKRLMTLIDALYDAGTKLVVTAAAPPEKLDPRPDLAFDFQRTISRLKEMQSESYLRGRR
jgi:cell division protein ZapE